MKTENEDLRERCEELTAQLNCVQHKQEVTQNEGNAWETALNKAVAMTRQSLDLKQNQMDEQRHELVSALQSKDEQIAELRIKMCSKEAMTVTSQAGFHFNEISPAKEGSLPD